MFTFIGNIIVCIFWGIVIASILILILYLILKSLYSAFRMSMTGMATSIILFILLFAQGTLMAGALYAKGYVDETGTLALEVISNSQESAGEPVTPDEAEKAKREISDAFLLLSPYISNLDTEELGGRSTSVAIAMTRGIKSLIDWYILRRVLWMTVMVITGGMLMGWSGKRGGTAYIQSPHHSTPGKYAGTYPGGNRPGRNNGF